MAQTSVGFKGTVNEIQWSRIANLSGQGGCLEKIGDLAVSQVAGVRSVSVAAGSAFGDGVLTTLSSAETVALPTPTNGQWYLLVLNRLWSDSSTRLAIRNSSTTSGTASGLVPTSYPASTKTAVGSECDLPIAWLWANSAGTAVTVVPILRVSAAVQPRRGDATTRDLVFGAPAALAAQSFMQGMGWFNTTLGYEERYSSAYDATLNPNGRAGSAGWYPAPGSIKGSLARSKSLVQLDSTFAGLNNASWWTEVSRVGIDPFNDGWVAPCSGDYRVEACVGANNYTGYIGITIDSTTYAVGSFAAQAAGIVTAGNSQPQLSKTIPVKKGQKIRLAALLSTPSGTLGPISDVADRSWFNVEYVGPSRAVV